MTVTEQNPQRGEGETRLAIVGLGKIAREQHVPEIMAQPAFRLAAVVDPVARLDGVAAFAELDAMIASGSGIDAVALCTPPQVRFELARKALLGGLDVLLEKPPGATVAEVQALARLAALHGRVLFTAWHSQFAPGVDPAREWLGGRRVTSMRVIWREDVRRFHPGQDWIFAPGGTGVFDPGINALSIMTRILPGDLRVVAAELEFPANRAAPIAAQLQMATDDGAPVTLDFDFREQGQPRWDMEIETDRGSLTLTQGGATVAADGTMLADQAALAGEYRRIYDRFADLIALRRSDVDASPLQLVADAFMLGRRHETEAFLW